MPMTLSRPSFQRGAVILEFALLLPLLLVMTFIVTEFGRAIMQYDALTKSVRDAARYLSVQLPGTHTAEARNLVVYGNPGGTGAPLVSGLTLAQVPEPQWQLAGSVPQIATVTVRVDGFTFRPLVGKAFGLDFGPITFGSIRATMRSAV